MPSHFLPRHLLKRGSRTPLGQSQNCDSVLNSRKPKFKGFVIDLLGYMIQSGIAFLSQHPIIQLLLGLSHTLLVGAWLLCMAVPGSALLFNVVCVTLTGSFFGLIDSILLVVPSFLCCINMIYSVVYQGASNADNYHPGMVDYSISMASIHCCFSILRLLMDMIGCAPICVAMLPLTSIGHSLVYLWCGGNLLYEGP